MHAQSATPRLLVILVVDQMRADYLTIFERHWARGFRTLVDSGAVFENAAYPFANTATCPGHTTVATGAFPRTHGITSNNWWDVARAQLVDCSIDTNAAAAHISYGRPAGLGNSAHLVAVPSIGEELRRQRPGSRVAVVSLKPDAAVGLAGHTADVVTWFDGAAGSFVTSRAYTTAPNPVVVDFLSRNPLAQELSGTWTLLKSPDSYLNRDATQGQRPPVGRDGLFPHEISGPDGPDARSVALWQQSPFTDRYLERMAATLVERLELGRDDIPDLLAIAFPALDIVGHAFGSDSREVEDVLARLDDTIGDLLVVLDRQVGRGRYVLALTADHGVTPAPSATLRGRVIVEDLQDRLEELLRSRWGAAGRGYVEVRGPYVYLSPGVRQRLRDDPPFWQSFLRTISEFPGMLRVLSPDELQASDSDPLIRAAALSYVPGRSGDLVLVAQPEWLLVGRNGVAAATHGSPHPDDQRVPLILFGSAIRAGRFNMQATPADIAPTLAHLAGITMPRAEGRVLQEALDNSATATAQPRR
jgi:predicted AlkP superfamily pyrophosphatase or phosphodiesterase